MSTIAFIMAGWVLACIWLWWYNEIRPMKTEFQVGGGWIGVIVKDPQYSVPYAQVAIGMPWGRWNHEEYDWGDTTTVWQFAAPTQITFKISPELGYSHFIFTVLGFGVSITQQTSY